MSVHFSGSLDACSFSKLPAMSSENTAHVYPLTIISFAAEAAMLRLPGILALSHATGVRLCSRQLPAQLTAMCFIAGRAGT